MKFSYVVLEGTITCKCLLGRDFLNNPDIKEVIFRSAGAKVQPSTDVNNILLIGDVYASDEVVLNFDSSVRAEQRLEMRQIFFEHYVNSIKPKNLKWILK